MHFDNLPILFILAISLIGNNFTVSIAALVLLLIKLLTEQLAAADRIQGH
jgi:uncharacterized membrane protein (DUF441 family)